MLVNLILISLGILAYLFFCWRRLKDDYPANQVFSASLIILCSAFVFSQVFKHFVSGWWFWGGISGILIAFCVSVYKYKLKFYENLEAFGIGFLIILAMIFFSDSVIASSISSLGFFLIILALIILFFVMEMKYKELSWYKSGKIGFSGLFILGLFFMIRSLIAIVYPHMLSYLVTFSLLDAILSALVSLTMFLVLYKLSKS